MDDSGSEMSLDDSSYKAASTPLTPISPRAGTRHPSDLYKIHHCSFENCDKAFNRPAKLEQHLRTHTNTRPFYCPHTPCTKNFMRDTHLKHHIKSAHTDIREHLCSWAGCNKAFLTATRLRRHLAVHEGRQQFACPEESCSKSFRKHSTLDTHVAQEHEERKPFICAFLDDYGKRCNAGFATAFKLNDHHGRMHDIRRFTCDVCASEAEQVMLIGKEAGQDLINPSKSDKSQNIYQFATYSALQEHMRLRHPPKCLECGLEASTPAALRAHLEIHHTDQSLQERRNLHCPVSQCVAAFTKRGNLNMHIKVVHGTTRFICGETDVSHCRGIDNWDGRDGCASVFRSKARLCDHVKACHLQPRETGARRSRRRHDGKPETVKTKPDRLEKLFGHGSASNTQEARPARTTSDGSRMDEAGLLNPNYSCIVPECDFVPSDSAGLDSHLIKEHKFSPSDLWEWRIAEALRNDNGLGSQETGQSESLDNQDAFELALDPQLSCHQHSAVDEWKRDELAMHALIHDEQR